MKSDCGLPANSGATQQCVSEEERIIRWKYAMGEYPGMTEKQLNRRINAIRKETNKP